jgi:hypothetical protein
VAGANIRPKRPAGDDAGPDLSYEEIRATLCKFYGWTFADVDNLSFEQIDSAIDCMPVEQMDGTIRPNPRQAGISVHSSEELKEFNENWRAYYGV